MTNSENKVNHNVLLLCMSTLNETNINYYNRKDNYYSCISQLEPGTKAVIDELSLKCEQPYTEEELNIICINTDKTEDAYEIYKNRIEYFLENGKDNNSRYEIPKETFIINQEYDPLITDLDIKLENLEKELKTQDTVSSSQKASDKLNTINCFIQDEMNHVREELQKRTALSTEQKALLDSNQKENAIRPNSVNSISSISPSISEIHLSKLIGELFDIPECKELTSNNLKYINNQLNDTLKKQNDITLQMFVDMQDKVRRYRLIYELQLAHIHDKLIEFETEYNQKIQSAVSKESLNIQQEYLEKTKLLETEKELLYEISNKLQQKLNYIEEGYESKIEKYIKQTIWKKIYENNNKSPRTYNNISINFESLQISYDIGEIICDVDEKIEKILLQSDNQNYRFYVDTQGGMRDNIITLTAIIKLLESKNIKTTDTFAINFNRKNFVNKIYTNTEKYEIYELVSGMQDLEQYLKIDRLGVFLRKYMDKYAYLQNCDTTPSSLAKDVKQYTEILQKVYDNIFVTSQKPITIARIAENLSLCQMENMTKDIRECYNSLWIDNDSCIAKLFSFIKELEIQKSQTKIYRNMYKDANTFYYVTQKIKDAFFSPFLDESGQNFKKKIQEIDIAKWCIKRDMIQQAATICAERSITQNNTCILNSYLNESFSIYEKKRDDKVEYLCTGEDKKAKKKFIYDSLGFGINNPYKKFSTNLKQRKEIPLNTELFYKDCNESNKEHKINWEYHDNPITLINAFLSNEQVQKHLQNSLSEEVQTHLLDNKVIIKTGNRITINTNTSKLFSKYLLLLPMEGFDKDWNSFNTNIATDEERKYLADKIFAFLLYGFIKQFIRNKLNHADSSNNLTKKQILNILETYLYFIEDGKKQKNKNKLLKNSNSDNQIS